MSQAYDQTSTQLHLPSVTSAFYPSSESEEPNPKAMVAQLPSSSDLSSPLSDAYIHQQCWYPSLKRMGQPRAVTAISRGKELILRVEHGEWGPEAPKWRPCGRGMNKDRSWERRYAPQTPLLGRGNAWSLALQSHAPQVPFMHLSVFYHFFCMPMLGSLLGKSPKGSWPFCPLLQQGPWLKGS